jgi:hypothetical protein
MANFVVFAAFVSWACSYGISWIGYYVTVLLVGSFVGLIVTLAVGTFAWKSAKPWPWWIVGLASLGCWLVIFFITVSLTPHAGDLMRVGP